MSTTETQFPERTIKFVELLNAAAIESVRLEGSRWRWTIRYRKGAFASSPELATVRVSGRVLRAEPI
jgi:hypothetical protein